MALSSASLCFPLRSRAEIVARRQPRGTAPRVSLTVAEMANFLPPADLGSGIALGCAEAMGYRVTRVCRRVSAEDGGSRVQGSMSFSRWVLHIDPCTRPASGRARRRDGIPFDLSRVVRSDQARCAVDVRLTAVNHDQQRRPVTPPSRTSTPLTTALAAVFQSTMQNPGSADAARSRVATQQNARRPPPEATHP